MRDEAHVSEETLNAYVDGVLSAADRERVEVHLSACQACRAEMQALRQLFAALDRLTPAPAPDLVPRVLARVGLRRTTGPRSLVHRRSWLVPALQAVAALALLAWGWRQVVSYWRTVVETVSAATPERLWTGALDWAVARWAELPLWPGAAWNAFQGRLARLPELGDLNLSLIQLSALGAALGALWLVGNVVLLRRALLNGRKPVRRH